MNRIHKVLAVTFSLSMLFCMSLSAEIIEASSIEAVLPIVECYKDKKVLVVFDDEVMVGLMDLGQWKHLFLKLGVFQTLKALHTLSIRTVCMTNSLGKWRWSSGSRFNSFTCSAVQSAGNDDALDGFTLTFRLPFCPDELLQKVKAGEHMHEALIFWEGTSISKTGVFAEFFNVTAPLDVVIVVSNSRDELLAMEKIAHQQKVMFQGIQVRRLVAGQQLSNCDWNGCLDATFGTSGH